MPNTLKRALAYYADPDIYIQGEVPGHNYAMDDGGQMARQALGLPANLPELSSVFALRRQLERIRFGAEHGRQHTIRVNETVSALGFDLAEFRADVTVNMIPEYGDGWDEPLEPAHAEFSSVKQVDGPYIEPLRLTAWADAWVDANQETIMADAQAEEPF